MANIVFEGKSYACEEGASVLDTLLAHGVAVAHSCGSGACQTCMLRLESGAVPQAAQTGLKDTLRAQGYFLPCVCHPQGDLEIARPDAALTRIEAVVSHITPLSQDVVCVGLAGSQPVHYRPGQFINLFKDETTARSYSLASVAADGELRLHVRRFANGQVSQWIHHELQTGDLVKLTPPAGNCFYLPGNPEQPLLLIGTGTGLAPLYGIARDALQQGHRGPIHLYHGSRDLAGLYLVEQLQAMLRQHANFHYWPCVSGEQVPEGFEPGRALDVALTKTPALEGWRVFLCGNPEMVKTARKRAFLAGAAMRDIFSDAFGHAA